MATVTTADKLAMMHPQQVGPLSMKVFATYTGKYTVRIHEVLDQEYRQIPDRYVISINLKFRELDALRPAGWLGWRRSEAIAEAKDLNKEIATILKALDACETYPMKGVEFTKKLHSDKLERILKRYSCTVE